MILEVQNGCFGYPKQKEVLHDINISLEAGHILSILGPNGIGKTTLLKCMIGLLSWNSGHSLLNGQDIQQLKAKEIWNTISYIPQDKIIAKIAPTQVPLVTPKISGVASGLEKRD